MLHGVGSSLQWPKTAPLFHDSQNLTASTGTTMQNGKSSSAGAISCTASKFGNTQTSVDLYDTRTEASCTSTVFEYVPKLSAVSQFACFNKGIHAGPATHISKSTSTDILGGGGAISLTLCDLSLDGVSINSNVAEHGNGGGVLINSGSVFLASSSTFEGNTATQGSGGGISCNACEAMTLEKSTKVKLNIAQTSGGGIHSHRAASYMLSSGTLFQSNTAVSGSGGAVHVSDTDPGIVAWKSTDDQFIENKAKEQNGGAILSVGVQVFLEGTTACKKNEALRGGGGCINWEPIAKTGISKDIPGSQAAWELVKPVIGADVTFSENKAAYGLNTATPVKALSTKNQEGVPFKTGITGSPKGTKLSPLPHVVAIDYYDQTVIGPSVYGMQIEAEISQSSPPGVGNENFGGDPGVVNEILATLGGKTTEYIDSQTKGSATFTDMTLQAYPGSGPHNIIYEASLEIQGVPGQFRKVKNTRPDPVAMAQCEVGESAKTKQSTVCDSCDSGKYGSVPGVCLDCPGGQYQNSKGTTSCLNCFQDTYSSEKGKASSADCTACPSLMITNGTTGNTVISSCLCPLNYFKGSGECVKCPEQDKKTDCAEIGLAYPILLPGYWRQEMKSDDLILQPIYKCPLKSCIGNSPNFTDKSARNNSFCADGYAEDGILCAVCAPQFVLSLGVCVPCANAAANVKRVPGGLIGVFAGFLLLLMALFLWFMTRPALSEDDEERVRGLIESDGLDTFWMEVQGQLLPATEKGTANKEETQTDGETKTVEIDLNSEITKERFTEVLKSKRAGLDPSQFDKLFDQVDDDHGGTISYLELKIFLDSEIEGRTSVSTQAAKLKRKRRDFNRARRKLLLIRNQRNVGTFFMKFKLLMGFAQVVSFLPVTFSQIPWPLPVINIASWLNFFS